MGVSAVPCGLDHVTGRSRSIGGAGLRSIAPAAHTRRTAAMEAPPRAQDRRYCGAAQPVHIHGT
eukprot:911625-Pleurochrysis_carterae.AAC.4